MSENKILDTMWDDNPIDITQEANFIWSIANKLRGSYMPDKYGDVVIPMTILRRFECALEATKQAVLKAYQSNPNYPSKALCKIAGFSFYNTSEYDLKELCNDSKHIAANFKNYISGFSANVKDIFAELEMDKHIDKMEKDGCLYSVVEAFSVLDLSIKTYDSIKMGYIFENLIGRFYQNVDAGQFYTGRDIIKLLVEILMAEGCDDIFDSHKVITVLDQACGTGGMLSTAYTYIKHYNPTAEVKLFGQEFMGQSYAVGLAEMLIKNQDSDNFRHVDTFKTDCFADTKMRFVIENPPFGTPWSGKDAKDGQEQAVRDEYAKGETGRWGHGLPSGGDSQMIFLQSAVDKMDDFCGRAAIIENGSPLFNGDTASGESQIRRWLLESDLIEAIIALPTDLFYNTGIQTYVWILSKNKRKERKGKIQLINAAEIYHKLRKAVGNKKNEITREDRKRITHLYADFVPSDLCKIYDNEKFFEEYAKMSRSKEGLKAAGEWHQLKPLFPSLEGKSVLDLGCGYGWHCKFAEEQGATKILGIDLSKKMIEEAQKRNSGNQIEYRISGLEEYDYPENEWDCVISNLALHYIEDIVEIFQKVYRTLKPGGIFLFNIEHPVFTAGVGQDWIYTDDGKPQYWAIDNYFITGERNTHFLGCDVVKQHHTLTQIIMGLLNNGFELKVVEEAEPPKEMMDIPGMEDELRRPMMLLVKAIAKK